MSKVSYNIRLEGRLKERLHKRAAAEHRTLANLIERILILEDETHHTKKAVKQPALNGHASKSAAA